MAKTFKQVVAGVRHLDVNTVIELRDKDGNLKPMFQENRLCMFLMKNSILHPHWINSKYSKYVSFLFGTWGFQKHYANLITNAGFAAAASRLNGDGAEAVFASIGQGVGTAAAAVTDTALGTEKKADGTTNTLHAIGAATASRITGSVTNDTAQWVGTINETAGMAITESGVFNNTTAGTMLCRQVFSAINVVSGDSLQLTWQVKNS